MCSPRWPQTAVLLSQSPERWDYGYELPRLDKVILAAFCFIIKMATFLLLE
jgi:hypothetical protein